MRTISQVEELTGIPVNGIKKKRMQKANMMWGELAQKFMN